MKLGRLMAIASVFPLALPVTASAAIVLSDNFNSENGGASSLNYTEFINFDVIGSNVDLVATPDFGITCDGDSGSCVDLAGSPGPGGLQTKHSYGFNTGDLVSLSFALSGNRRVNNGTDRFYAGFLFASATTIDHYTLGGGGSSFDLGTWTNILSINTASDTVWNQNFQEYTLSFIATGPGLAKPYLGTTEGSAYGPVLDNVRLDIASAVPEPAALPVFGAGLIGASAMRKRTKKAPNEHLPYRAR